MTALVLIAEDDAEIAAILDAYLTREGFRTVQARDGRTTLDLHLALKPDLVLLDITMPRLDGWEVLAELRRRGQTPAIMITALDQDIDRLPGPTHRRRRLCGEAVQPDRGRGADQGRAAPLGPCQRGGSAARRRPVG